MLVTKVETSPARPDDASFGIPLSEKGVMYVPLEKVPQTEMKVAGRTCRVS